jgi:hypothetical protein
MSKGDVFARSTRDLENQKNLQAFPRNPSKTKQKTRPTRNGQKSKNALLQLLLPSSQ